MRSIAAYREEPCKTALNRVKGLQFLGWSLNPYMGCVHRCTYCYVRSFERRADRAWDDRYGASIRVKVNIPEVLGTELRRRSWKRELVGIGAATDPYQPAEGSYRLTRRCIEALAGARTPLSVITRSPLVVRDIDVLQHATSRADAGVSLSIPTLDEQVWRTTEPGTPPPRQRLRAVRMLVDAGISASVAVAPILPGISDAPEQLGAVVRAAREAGAVGLWAKVAHLQPGTKEHFMEALARDWPEQVPSYQALYDGRAYLDRSVSEPILERVAILRDHYEVADRRELHIDREPAPEQMALELG
jgi:DNA repair photolyase